MVTVSVSRRIPVPVEAVYDAWIDPAQAGGWLFRTEGGELERCEIDPRVGGRFRIDERRGGEIAEHHGEYVEMDRPYRLAFDFWTNFSEERTRVRIDIARIAGDGSLITLTHDGVWPDWADKTRMGWTMILDQLGNRLND